MKGFHKISELPIKSIVSVICLTLSLMALPGVSLAQSSPGAPGASQGESPAYGQNDQAATPAEPADPATAADPGDSAQILPMPAQNKPTPKDCVNLTGKELKDCIERVLYAVPEDESVGARGAWGKPQKDEVSPWAQPTVTPATAAEPTTPAEPASRSN